MNLQFTWSRWTANPVEHIADNIKFSNKPICGARLSTERQTFGGAKPSGLAPVCKKCLSRLTHFRKTRRYGLWRNDFCEVEIRKDGSVFVVSQVLTGGWSEISRHDSYTNARNAGVAYIKKSFRDIKELLP